MDIQIDKILGILKKEVLQYNVPVINLIKIQTNDPYRILIASVLSARTNDKITVKSAKRLFAKADSLNALSKLTEREIADLIYPVGFHKNKAKFLKKIPKIIKEKFKGEIPRTLNELIELPGVGRKVANLVSSVAFGRDGICVDTHVHRIMNRFGYIRTKTPRTTEMELRNKLPRKHWKTVNYILVAFGQNLCRPISPFCSKCPVNRYCDRAEVKVSR